MSKVKISVIMAVYNSENTIAEAIESILAQTYNSWEFVICDDCSTDNTYEIVKDYKEKYTDKIHLLKNEKNMKLSYSLNHCLKYAKGDYIARMDGDDISLPERFEQQIKFMEKYPEYDVVGTSMIPFDENGDRYPITCKQMPNKFDLIKSTCFNHATILMKKSVYNELGGYTVLPRTTRGQDYDLWFRFFSAGFKGYNLQKPLYKVREGVNDLKRRTLKTRIQGVQTRLIGYRLLNYPIKYYIFAFKPIVAGLIPKKVMYNYHKRKYKV